MLIRNRDSERVSERERERKREKERVMFRSLYAGGDEVFLGEMLALPQFA